MADPILRALRMDRPTMTSLNEDILLHLYNMLTSKTLLALMSTCRYMFRAGLPTLLARPCGTIRPRRLSAFHKFLYFFAPASFSSLRDIRFSDHCTPAEHDIIFDILQRAANLRSLEISACDALEWREDIVEAIISLSKLKKLIFTYEDTDACHTILERLQAPLAYLTLQVDNDGEYQLALLSNFQGTLEDIYLQYAILTDISFSCHKLTQMFLQYCSDPHLSVLINAFPNLEVLSLNSGYSRTSYGNQKNEELRQKNVAFQARKQWHALTSLTADEVGIYMLGLQAEVDSVILPVQLIYGENKDWGWLNRSLQSLRPRHLRLKCLGETAGLTQALSVGMERLHRLDLKVTIFGGSILEDVIGGIYTALRTIQARMFSCTLDRTHELLANIEDFDPEEIAEGAMSACATLEFIILKTSNYPDFENSYWLVTKDGDERSLQSVDDMS